MKRTVSLFEFMPYGAPELIAAARPNLARALLVGSSLPVVLFAALLTFLPLLRVSPEVIRIPPIERWMDPDPPSIVRPPVFESVAPAASRSADDGIPVPVPEDDAPPVIDDRSGPVDGTTSDTPFASDATPPVPGPPAAEADPTRGVWVYAEELPQVVTPFKPPYPEMAREAGVEGTVMVHALIGTNGRVIRVELDEKINQPLLNAAALEAAIRWTFTPALANGRPVKVWYAIPFKFVLNR